MRDLGEEKAAACRDGGDKEGQPQLVPLNGRAKDSQRSWDSHKRQQAHDEERRGDNLADHAEHGQDDDHVMGHA